MKDTPPQFSREEWQRRSHFHPLSEAQVLELVEASVARFSGSKAPIVLLDLDSTLYEVGPRSFKIFQEWLATNPPMPKELKKALGSLTLGQMGYSVKDTFCNLGFTLNTDELKLAASELKAFWWDRFFTNDYLPIDRPYPGSVEYAERLYQLGAQLCYLTGRDEKTMRLGTEQNLLRDGFPWKMPGTHLLMKSQSSWSDANHKTSQADWINSQGELIASFENEPLNLVSLSEIFPEGHHVFVDTIHSEVKSPPGKNLYRIKGFSSFLSSPPKSSAM